MADFRERTLALAGGLQATHLVERLARSGLIPQDTFEHCVRTLFVFDAADTPAIYGGISNLSLGFRVAEDVFTNVLLREHTDAVRYLLELMGLERRAPGDLLSLLGAELGRIRLAHRLDDGNVSEDAIVELGELYGRTLGTIEPRIQVLGSRQHLQNPYNVARLRALLLAGFRSAVLWHQLGGRRWQLLLRRRALREGVAYCRDMQRAADETA